MQLIPDTIDLRQYLHGSDTAVKVKGASEFIVELKAKFLPKETRKRAPDMFSTKLRRVLEFRPGEVTCWTGYNGHRKSLFTGQVELDLCVQNERVLCSSFEMQPADSLARIARQAFGGEEIAPISLERFSRWTDGRLWVFDHLGRISPEQCVAVCRYFAAEHKGSHVVIDSMMMVCASEEHLDEQKQFTTDVVRVAQETGLHIHLVTHCRKPHNGDESKPPTKYDIRGSGAISDQAHNVVTVWANKAKKAKLETDPNDMEASAQPDALVSVEKQRNGQWEGRVKLWFDETSLRFVDDRTSPIEPYRLEIDRE